MISFVTTFRCLIAVTLKIADRDTRSRSLAYMRGRRKKARVTNLASGSGSAVRYGQVSDDRGRPSLILLFVDLFELDPSPRVQALPCAINAREKARVMLQPVIEPVIL